MASLNRVEIIGNLGQDPEARTFQDGGKLVNLSVATSRKWRDKASGETREDTEWHRITITGGLADVAAKYLTKGSKVYLAGRLKTRKWQDQSGQDRWTTEILVGGFGGEMILLDGRSDGGGGASSRAPAPPAPGIDDDEIPF